MTDKASFLEAMSRFVNAVTVVTAGHIGRPYGLTAPAVCSLSAELPSMIARPTASGAHDRAALADLKRSSSGPPLKKISLHDELPDLGMRSLAIVVPQSLSLSADTRFERSRRLLARRRQGDLRLRRRGNLPSRSFRRGLLRLSRRSRPRPNYAAGSKFRVHFTPCGHI